MTIDTLKGTNSSRLGRVRAMPDHPGRALLVFASGAELSLHYCAAQTLVITDEACDVSALLTGRAPLLLDHERHTDSVVGVIDGAWIENGVGWAVARFGRSRRAQEVRHDIEDGVLTNCSMGFQILEVEHAEGSTPEFPHHRITRWKPYEISIVAIGADARACVQPTSAEVRLDELLKRKCEERAVDARKRRLNALRPDEWRAWSRTTARDLADEFDLRAQRVEESLLECVEQHLKELANGC